MLKYLVFAGEDYYPTGGAQEFVAAYDNADTALLEAPRWTDWVHVAEFDGKTLTIVAEITNGNVTLYPERMAHVRNGPTPIR